MSTQNTLRTLRVTDPVLTKLAQGYFNANFVSEVLFPIAEIPNEGGAVPVFGRQAFRLTSTIREIHGVSNRLTPEYAKSIIVTLDEHDIEYPMDYREEYEASYNLKQYALNVTQDVIGLGREIEVATLAQNADNYDSDHVLSLKTAKKQLNDTSTDILKIIDDAKAKIAGDIGKLPNVCVIAGDVWAHLKENAGLLDRIKYTRTGLLTPQVFAELIEVDQVVIGEATQEVSEQLQKIWTDCIILAYVPRAEEENRHIYAPSFAYTLRRKDGLFVDTYQENGGKVQVIRCTDIYKPYILGKSAGYLIKDCLSK
ncbi:inorganic pyrophosphatase [Avibacterium volantium]|uniref:inorganic pyrophosphatase n=1 Tax=Avibacterium TaxID=292486 RepID=UPI0039FB9D4A